MTTVIPHGKYDNDEPLTLGDLDTMRKNFLEFWYQIDAHEKHPMILIDWHRYLTDIGHFEAYNYWLLSEGRPEEMTRWEGANPEAYRSFAKWFSEHPLQIDSEHFFSRRTIDE
jgi:hypothetical protein